jgi:PAS domain S-box-containing protein
LVLIARVARMLTKWTPTIYRRTPMGFALAVLLVLAAVVLQQLFPRLPPFATLLTAILLACFLSGRNAGIVALVVATIFAIYRATKAPTDTIVWEIIGIVCFLLGGSLCVLVIHFYEASVDRLRRERRRLDAALKAANAAIWELSPDRRLYWDENFYNLVGLDARVDPPTTPRFLQMIDPEHRERMAEARRQMDRGEEPKPLDEYRLTRPDGRVVWLENHRIRISDGGTYFIGITQDITRRKLAEKRVKGLLREAAHRAKNQFAVILAMAREARQEVQSADEFHEVFGARLQALARSHDLLVSGDWKGASIRELLMTHLEPFGAASRCDANGADFTITARAAQYLGMAFHELATNALKHGALASDDGRIAATWNIKGDDFTFVWKEKGAATGETAKTGGFGTKVLSSLAPAGLSGTSHTEFEADGMRWTITAPIWAVMEVSADRDGDSIVNGQA